MNLDNLWRLQGHLVMEHWDPKKPGERWESVRQIPTFMLDGNIQGILTAEHAVQVARSVMQTPNLPSNQGAVVEYVFTAEKVG